MGKLKLYYEKAQYIADGSLAIRTYWDDPEFGFREPYGDVTVCLVDYGMTPEKGTIFMPTYKMTPDFVEQVLDEIAEEVIREIPIGFGRGLHVKLKKNWEHLVDMN